MGAISDIQAAFTNKAVLFAQTEGLPIFFENQKYVPVLKQRHLRAFFIPGDSPAAGCGVDAPNKFHGIYMINVYTEQAVGYGPAYAIADRVASEFKRGTKLDGNGIEVTINKALIESHDVNEAWYIVPVGVLFYAYTPNQ